MERKLVALCLCTGDVFAVGDVNIPKRHPGYQVLLTSYSMCSSILADSER